MDPSSKPVPEIPPDTLQAAREVYHIDHAYLQVGDHLDEILANVSIPALDPTTGLGKSMTSRLALVTSFQYAERIPDDLAAQATFKRMDWKYALHLPIQHPGFNAGIFCHFRQNIFTSKKAMHEMELLMEHLGNAGLFARITIRSLDAGDALVTVCNITRLYQLNEAMKSTLSMLVATCPDWLRENALPHWYTRYRTGGLGRYTDRDNQQVLHEIAILETDIDHLLERLSQLHCRDSEVQPETQRLKALWEKLSLKRNLTTQSRAGCAGCTSRYIAML